MYGPVGLDGGGGPVEHVVEQLQRGELHVLSLVELEQAGELRVEPVDGQVDVDAQPVGFGSGDSPCFIPSSTPVWGIVRAGTRFLSL